MQSASCNKVRRLQSSWPAQWTTSLLQVVVRYWSLIEKCRHIFQPPSSSDRPQKKKKNHPLSFIQCRSTDLKCMNFPPSYTTRIDFMRRYGEPFFEAIGSLSTQTVRALWEFWMGNNPTWMCLCWRWRASPSPSGTIKPTFWNSRAVCIRTAQK